MSQVAPLHAPELPANLTAVEEFGPLLAEVWREACRHIQMEEALERIGPLLRRHLPLDTIAVQRIDTARRSVEALAADGRNDAPLLSAPRIELNPAEIDELVAWCRTRRLLHGSRSAASGVTAKLAAGAPDADRIVGPLVGEDAGLGVLVLIARSPRRFERAHLAVARALLEPFAVALDNDARLRELRTGREAAEAERLSLLTRLGRRDVADAIVGEEGGLRLTMERARLVAPSDVPVLLLGETGSGKEVVARAIHRGSPRASRPFLRVNCGAMSPGLIDSELFGHERGSFTGASGERKGWFERADGGTLFLDEIGELPPEVQVRLLRVLQDGTFERVGGQRTLHADIRIVAATHRDLQAMVADERFRQDLWFRLAVFPILVPPLRDRPDDIPLLAAHFAARAASRFGVPRCVLTSADEALLVGYAWPGNVRELIAVMERAVILGEGHSLEVATALGTGPVPVASPSLRAPVPRPATGSSARGEEAFPTLDTAMARHIEAALTRTGGRIEGRSGAARLLDINPHTLRARMRKLGIDWNRFRADARDEDAREDTA
jgi:hydrogenase-4 transcriptional activator